MIASSLPITKIHDPTVRSRRATSFQSCVKRSSPGANAGWSLQQLNHFSVCFICSHLLRYRASFTKLQYFSADWVPNNMNQNTGLYSSIADLNTYSGVWGEKRIRKERKIFCPSPRNMATAEGYCSERGLRHAGCSIPWLMAASTKCFIWYHLLPIPLGNLTWIPPVRGQIEFQGRGFEEFQWLPLCCFMFVNRFIQKKCLFCRNFVLAA